MTDSRRLRVVSHPRDADARPAIVVAVLTFRRPDLLAGFLEGYFRLNPPTDCVVRLLVVDNDSRESGRETFVEWQDRIPAARYVVEPRMGIPVARNRALDEAVADGADALCFIDDDEAPDAEWLTRLVACWKRSGATLVGGPVEVAQPPQAANWLQRVLNASLAARARRKNRIAARAATQGGRFTVVTNNWLCDLRWLVPAGLRFDETLLMTGGSDTAFCRAADATGSRKAWAVDAVVRETIPLDRLSIRYQFWRAMSQSITHYHLKAKRASGGGRVLTVSIALVRAVLGLLLLAVPIYGVGSLAIAIRSMGWSAGRIQALRGRRSSLYATTTITTAEMKEVRSPKTMRRAA